MQVELTADGKPLSFSERIASGSNKVAADWGADYDAARAIYHAAQRNDKMVNAISNWLFSKDENGRMGDKWYLPSPFLGQSLYLCDAIHWTLFLFDPRLSKDHPDQIAIYASRREFEREPRKRTTLKPHRAVRKMMPWLTEAEIEKVGDMLREQFIVDTSGYTVKCSDEADAFARAYSHTQAPYRNPDTTYNRKSLASSCMRYNAKDHGLPYHPAEAYASGDFWMVHLEDSDGRIAGRCVVRKDPCCAGPVYGVNEQAIDMIEAYITGTLGGTLGAFSHLEWEGAKLKAIPHKNGYIAPYLDCDPQQLSDEYEDGFLVISECGNICGASYGGVLAADERVRCSYCVDRLYESDVLYGPDGECCCEYCFSSRFFLSDYSNEAMSVDDRVSVAVPYSWVRDGYTLRYWSEDEAQNHAYYCEGPGEWYHPDLVVMDYNGDPITIREAERNYFVCAIDGEYYPDDMAVTLDGETVSKIHLDTSLHTLNETTGEWETRDAA